MGGAVGARRQSMKTVCRMQEEVKEEKRRDVAGAAVAGGAGEVGKFCMAEKGEEARGGGVIRRWGRDPLKLALVDMKLRGSSLSLGGWCQCSPMGGAFYRGRVIPIPGPPAGKLAMWMGSGVTKIQDIWPRG
eukprot:767081-Hanusia_phi.AAC.1